MRAAIGDILEVPRGKDILLGLLDECRGIAGANRYAPREATLARSRDFLTAAGSTLTASMLRDIARNAPIEADHIIGDLLRRGAKAGLTTRGPSLLAIAYANLKAYEARRKRMSS
jgi:2-dehydropantoate 2-reductase